MSVSKNDQAIHQLVNDFAEGWNEHDIHKFCAVFEEDADHTNVQGIYRKGKKEIETSHEPLFNTIWSKSTFTVNDSQIRYLSAELASVDVRWELTDIYYPNSDQPASRKGLIHFILRKSNNDWKVSVMHNMDIPPATKKS